MLKQLTTTLNISEIYQTIQGETSFAGLPTTMIRLSACNLRCVWCDTTHSFSRGEPWSLETIHEHVDKLGSKNICITGGEPLLQESIFQLMESLCDRNYIVSLETSGSISIEKVDPRVTVILDIKCPGSQMENKNYWENIGYLREHHEVKFVLLDRKDYEYAKIIINKYQLKTVLLSPVHGKLDPKTLVNWILEDKLEVRLNLQIHKYIWEPETQGV